MYLHFKQYAQMNANFVRFKVHIVFQLGEIYLRAGAYMGNQQSAVNVVNLPYSTAKSPHHGRIC